jgi:energy-coupling factor transporter transmembrane protein EcfT
MHPVENLKSVYLKLGFLPASAVLALYADNIVLLAAANAAIMLLCILSPGLFREILSTVKRIAIGFPFLLLIFIASTWWASDSLPRAVISGSAGAAVFILKIHFVLWANLFLVQTTEPQQLALALHKLYMPRELCIMIIVIIRFFPVMFEEAASIYQVQRARGFEFRRALYPRNWLPLAAPLVLQVMKKSHDLAIVLELKGLFVKK